MKKVDPRAIAALNEADQRMTDLQADDVPEDDPRFMEALADYQVASAVVMPGLDAAAFVVIEKGQIASIYIPEPEAN